MHNFKSYYSLAVAIVFFFVVFSAVRVASAQSNVTAPKIPIFAEIPWGSHPDQVASLVKNNFGVDVARIPSPEVDQILGHTTTFHSMGFITQKAENISLFLGNWTAFFAYDDSPSLIEVILLRRYDISSAVDPISAWDNIVSQYEDKYGYGVSYYYMTYDDPNNDALKQYIELMSRLSGTSYDDMVIFIRNNPTWTHTAFDDDKKFYGLVSVNCVKSYMNSANSSSIVINYVSPGYYSWLGKVIERSDKSI